MKILIIGAGAIGSLYGYLLHKAGMDVTMMARNSHYDFIKSNGLVLTDELSGERFTAKIKVTDTLNSSDKFDLVLVTMRKNHQKTIFPVLASNPGIRHILFIGNNVAGFDSYFNALPKEKLLFGFGRAGGGRINHVIHFVDREKISHQRMSLMLGEPDGQIKKRTREIIRILEKAEIPVRWTGNMDGWLKYHLALVLPLCGMLLKHQGDNYMLADSPKDLKFCLHAYREMGGILKQLGYQPPSFQERLFFWIPTFMFVPVFKKILRTKFAEIAFAMHAKAAADEFAGHLAEFKQLARAVGRSTPLMDQLDACFNPDDLPV